MNELKLTHVYIHDVLYTMVLRHARHMPLSDLKTLDMQVQKAKRIVPSKLIKVEPKEFVCSALASTGNTTNTETGEL